MTEIGGDHDRAPAAEGGPRRYDLGGVGRGRDGRLTVNLEDECDIRHDIRDLDGFLPEDGTADEFYLCHTLEHVPVADYVRFLEDLHRKLRPGGRVIVIQSDIGEVIKLWIDGTLSFRAMRTPIFTPPAPIRDNPHNVHHNMWTAEELADDFRAVGFTAETFDAGSWPYDHLDELYPERTREHWGVAIPNLGVIATKDHTRVTGPP